MQKYDFALDLHSLVFAGPAAPSGEFESHLRIVFSDLVLPEFRWRNNGIEFPLNLDMLESYLRGLGYSHGDYAFLPGAEQQAEMVQHGRPLHTLGVRGQTPVPVREAGLWAINMLNYPQAPAFFSLLHLAGVPALRSERAGGGYPLVVLGGHIWPNPLPLSDFYDILVVGEGEEVLAQIAALYDTHPQDRAGLLAAVAQLDGTYVPGVTRQAVRRARIDFEKTCYPAGSSYLLDGVGAVLLARGCPHACAFCNHSQIGGSYRIKPAEQVKAQIDRLTQAGARTILPVASTVASYQSGEETIFDVLAYIQERGAAVKILSDRPEHITQEYLRLTIPETGKMILAPEAGPRIREKVFQKTIQEQTIRDLIGESIAAGINRVQIYVILCVPPISRGVVDFLPQGFDGEQPGDLRYLAELARAIADQMIEAGLKNQPGRPYVQIECMPFVPAIGTRLQKTAFPSYAHYQAHIRALQSMLGPYYQDMIEVNATMDQTSHLLRAFLERGGAARGAALWQVWSERQTSSLTPREVLQAIRLNGQDWKSIAAEYSGRRLPYEDLIADENEWGECPGGTWSG